MIGETVVRIRAPFGEPDRYKNPTRDWANATRAGIDHCAVAPRIAAETTDEYRQGVVIGVTVYAPAGADVLATDRLEVRGEEFEVDGEPAVWNSPFAGLGRGVEIQLRRVTG